VLLLIATTSLLNAAESEFAYSTRVQEVYTGDVFRTGGDAAEGDFITTFGLQGSLAWRTPRSVTLIDYSPEYLKYATFDVLDDLNHRFRSSWSMTPGRRSSVGVGLRYSQITQQSGFRDFLDLGGDVGEPVVELTRRGIFDFVSHHRVEISRRWSMETRAFYLLQSFDTPDLSDSSSIGLSYSADARVRGTRRLGGIVRIGENRFDSGTSASTSGEVRDQVVNAEVFWSQQEGEVFKWRIASGAFRIEGDERPTSTEPTFRLSASWELYKSSLLARYDNGFSISTGAVGTQRRETANATFSRRWGRGFSTSVAGDYIRLENLENDLEQRSLDGYSVSLEATYNWPTRWELRFRVLHLRQDGTSGRSLDYIEALVGLTFTPDQMSGAARLQ
jgi:hypothetical protein